MADYYNPDLNKKIMEQVKNAEMKPKTYFWFLDSLKILGIIVFSFLAIFVLSFFVWDFLENLKFLNYEVSPTTILQNSLFEFLLVALFFGLIVFWIYKQTDWPFVRDNKTLISIINVIIIFLGIGSFIIVENLNATETVFTPTRNQIEGLPLRGGREEKILTDLENKGYFVGFIADIQDFENDQYKKIIVTNKKYKKEIVVEKFKLKNLDLEKPVVIRFKQEEGNQLVTDIRNVKLRNLPKFLKLPPEKRPFQLREGN